MCVGVGVGFFCVCVWDEKRFHGRVGGGGLKGSA